MVLIFILYMLFASTFTLGKAALDYINPILFIGIRMTIAGSILLIYQYLRSNNQWRFSFNDIHLFVHVILFHIYCAYILEFWALQYVTSAKACLIYNLSPFITTLLLYLFYNKTITQKQLIGLLVGFMGFLPIIITYVPSEAIAGQIANLSLPEIALFASVIASSYGWLVVKELITHRNYSPTMVNGIGMLGGGIGALCTSLLFEGRPSIHEPTHGHIFPMSNWLQSMILKIVPSSLVPIFMLICFTAMLILIANIICYNLYGYLLKRYSPVFLSFAGFTTPIFAALFGWVFLSEKISSNFLVTLVFVIAGLYVYYQDEYIQ